MSTLAPAFRTTGIFLSSHFLITNIPLKSKTNIINGTGQCVCVWGWGMSYISNDGKEIFININHLLVWIIVNWDIRIHYSLFSTFLINNIVYNLILHTDMNIPSHWYSPIQCLSLCCRCETMSEDKDTTMALNTL